MMAQILGDPFSRVPTLGASGAIAAVMGAFLVTYPADRIRTVLFFLFFVRIAYIPAALLIGFWFLIQALNVGAVAQVRTGGVAYLAHVGGFLFGVVTARFLESPRPEALSPQLGLMARHSVPEMNSTERPWPNGLGSHLGPHRHSGKARECTNRSDAVSLPHPIEWAPTCAAGGICVQRGSLAFSSGRQRFPLVDGVGPTNLQHRYRAQRDHEDTRRCDLACGYLPARRGRDVPRAAAAHPV